MSLPLALRSGAPQSYAKFSAGWATQVACPPRLAARACSGAGFAHQPIDRPTCLDLSDTLVSPWEAPLSNQGITTKR